MPCGRQADDLEFFIFAGIADVDVEHEPIELRFGQRIGAFLLDRVLRRQDEERLRQSMQLSAGGDLVFLHRFQQRRLRLGRRAVDFVGQDHVREDRAADEAQDAPAGRSCLLR